MTKNIIGIRRLLALMLLSLILVGGALSFSTATAHAASRTPASVHPLVNLDASCYVAFYNSTNGLDCVNTTGYNGISVNLFNVTAVFVNHCTAQFWVREYDNNGGHTLTFNNPDGGQFTFSVAWGDLTQVDVTSIFCTR